jgi:hypothetical protein
LLSSGLYPQDKEIIGHLTVSLIYREFEHLLHSESIHLKLSFTFVEVTHEVYLWHFHTF